MLHFISNNISRRRIAVFGALLASTALCCLLVVARAYHTGSLGFGFLIWNLFLAWIPFLAALLLHDGDRKRWRPLLLLAIGAFWLLFYPNAPYIITDFVHLYERPGIPLWFDLLLIGSSAFTGMLLGFVSLYLVHGVVRQHYGWVAGWLFVVLANCLSGFGIYLGRFERFNSWDIISQPWALLADVWMRLSNPLDHPETMGVSAAFGAFLLVGYLVVGSLLHFGVAERDG